MEKSKSDSLRKYILAHCVNPVTIRVTDSLTGAIVARKVPCGKCLHCRLQYKNEWTTRLYAQKMYSKHTYFVSLDYAPLDQNPCPVADAIAAETAATYHNINYHHTYGLHPLLLRKEHLQKFFKRLRNQGHKFQYFACGEYGGSFKGHGFGRPHFHTLIFTDEVIIPADFESAWTIDGYKIGRVDFEELPEDDSTQLRNGKSNKFVFSYVCKYLNKDEFKFENLATIKFHRCYFETLEKEFTNECDLFIPEIEIENEERKRRDWKKYCDTYGPFTCCSKRPSIGYAYLRDNIQRFQKKDFRLFDIPGECKAFPTYFLRKTKESACCVVATGSVSGLPTTSTNIVNIISVLRTIRDTNNLINDYPCNTFDYWRADKGKTVLWSEEKQTRYYVENHTLHFYDVLDRAFYQWTGYEYQIWYKVKKLGYVRGDTVDISTAIRFLEQEYTPYANSLLRWFAYRRKHTEHDLEELLTNSFPDDWMTSGRSREDHFKEYVYAFYKTELSNWQRKKIEIYNTKQKF